MEHSKFTFKTALQLAAPHTWSAAILPVLLATSCAIGTGHAAFPPLVAVLLAISVLMQSSVNALNDYFDFVKGVDSADDNLEVDDAALLHSGIRPKAALWFALGLLAAAFALGAYVVWAAGWVPLAIAIVGAAVVLAYSGGKAPLSYLPVGELASGLVMGVLVTLASYYALARSLGWEVVAWSAPLFLQIGLVMLTNNACDIEKDAEAGRRTLPVLLGRPATVRLYRALVVADLAGIAAVVLLWFAPSAVMLPFLLLLAIPFLKNVWKCPFVQASRVQAMALATNLNACLGCMYCVCVLAAAAIGQ